MVPLVLISPGGSRALRCWGHAVNGSLWAAVEPWSLIQGHGGEGIVWISLTIERMAALTQRLLVQVQREAALWSSGAAAQQRDPGRAREVRRLDTKETTQPSEQRGGVVGFLVFFNLLQIGLKLHILLGNTSLDYKGGLMVREVISISV